MLHHMIPFAMTFQSIQASLITGYWMKRSVEQKVIELQDLKKEVIKQVSSDDDGSVTSASLEDIAFILG